VKEVAWDIQKVENPAMFQISEHKKEGIGEYADGLS
jgi:hypothetical protein